MGAVGAVGAAVPFVGSWSPSAKAKAAGAPVEINISKIEPGQMVTVEWRGKPVYVVRRTKEALAGLKVNEAQLRDPTSAKSTQPSYAKSESRSISGKEEIVVLLGVCTHLGCAPASSLKLVPLILAVARHGRVASSVSATVLCTIWLVACFRVYQLH